MPSSTSRRQIKANRRNAKKSTGPRTAQGKAVVGFNALKHGMTASSDVIAVEGFDESQEEFDALHSQLIEEYGPVGIGEHLEVHKIATTYWRQRRVYRCEAGEMQKDMLNWEKASKGDMFSQIRLCYEQPENHKLGIYLWGSSEGRKALVDVLRRARHEVIEEGYFSIETRTELKRCFRGIELEPIQAIIRVEKEICSRIRTLETRKKLVGGRELDNQKALVALMDLVIEQYVGFVKAAEFEEKWERKVQQDVFSLASKEATERILRYDSHFDRQLKQSLTQLRILQERRGVYWAA